MDTRKTQVDEVGGRADAETALARWVDALNAGGDRQAVEAAVDADVRVERLGLGAHAGALVEVIEGTDAVARWMALSPPDTTFAPDGELDGDPNGWTVGYRLEVAGFKNGGRWRFRLGASRRIAWVEHDPRQLADEQVAEVRDPAETWRRYVAPIPAMHHHHGNSHDDEAGEAPPESPPSPDAAP